MWKQGAIAKTELVDDETLNTITLIYGLRSISMGSEFSQEF